MKEVSLINSEMIVIVDDEDYEMVSQYRWYWRELRGGYGYVRTNYGRRGRTFNLAMHRLILGVLPRVAVDHKDRNPLNNRKENLRIVTGTSINQINRCASRNKHPASEGYKGVSYARKSRHKPFQVMIGLNGKKHYVGSFPTAETAARAYDEAARRLHGEYAVLNFPVES